jgi:hypothetical protein
MNSQCTENVRDCAELLRIEGLHIKNLTIQLDFALHAWSILHIIVSHNLKIAVTYLFSESK